MAASPRLSKSRFTAGLQCPRLLWWKVHEPDAPELVPDAMAQLRFEEGTEVGERARTYVPDGKLIDLPHDRITEKIAMTRAALDAGERVIYEASFFADRTFAAVDILERVDGGFGLIEVKSSVEVRPEHLPDAAVQAHVLTRSGLDVRRVELMHLNRACAHPDLSNLFVREDVTSEVEGLLPAISAQIESLLEVLAGPLPVAGPGDHCARPYPCPFQSRCWAELPEHHVTTLYYSGRKAWDWVASGLTTIHDLPAGLQIHPAAERQRRSVQAGRMIVEPGLAAALTPFDPPIAFLDFETVAPAIPVWPGCHPYDAIPVQFSCHVQAKGGGIRHFEWIAEGPTDPRAEIARRVVQACEDARPVAAYYSIFERDCLRRLASAVDPALAAQVRDVEMRLVDPLPVVRDHVYHPDFGGSFSLKSVLPVLVPDLSYENMDVAEGTAATLELKRLLFEGDTIDPADKAHRREALRRYCELDTWAMVKLVEALRALAEGDRSARRRGPTPRDR